MTAHTTFLPLIATLVFAAAFADEFKLSDLDDGKWELAIGSLDCPKELKIDTERSVIGAAVLHAGQDGGVLGQSGGTLKVCTGKGSAELFASPLGGNGFQKGIAAKKKSGDIWGGVQIDSIACGQITLPNGTFWQFFSPFEDFKVNPSKTLGSSALLAAGSDKDFSFEKGHIYLVLGNLCLYEQESRAEGLVESLGDLASATDEVDDSFPYEAIYGRASDESDYFNSIIDACFPARATVETAGGAVKRMDEIQIGDEIKVGPGAFSRVFMFTHKSADTKSTFVRIATDSGARVELTPGHYIYANDNLVAAATVKDGDRLRLSDGRDAIVLSVSTVQLAGLYNPQTVSGDIAVDGVVSSTYTTAVKPVFAHALLAPMRAFRLAFGLELTVLESGGGWLTGLAPRG